MPCQSKFMLAKDFVVGMKTPRGYDKFNPEEWMASEKLDGYRAQTVGDEIISRNGNKYYAPDWFLNAMKIDGELVNMDGELFAGRENFQDMGVVRRKKPSPTDWLPIKFHVFDIPNKDDLSFYDRYQMLEKIVDKITDNWSKFQKDNADFKTVACPVVLCKHEIFGTLDKVKDFYKSVLDKGGEGIMLKNPDSVYKDGRTYDLLKYKPVYDMEAVITGYKPGTGKYKKHLGAFICAPLKNCDTYQVKDENKDNEFSTSGMTDEIRESYKKTHPIGTIITIEYSGFTNSGKPRFARYLRIREDVILKKSQEEEMDSSVMIDKITDIFTQISKFEKSNGQPYKSKAYDIAIKSIANMKDQELTPDNLINIKGIGKSIIEKIQTIIKTGTLDQYEKIKDYKDPKEEFMNIHGVGSVKAKQLVKAGFKSLDQLKSSDNIDDYLNDVQIKGLKWHSDINGNRIPYNEIESHEIYLKKVLKEIDHTAQLTVAGSYRRKKESSGDIDILINTPSVKNNSIFNKFIDKLYENEYLKDEFSRGQKKFMGICSINTIGRRIDIMYTKSQEYPFAILYFTGSMEFNVKMRGELLDKGLSLNEYGIKKDGKTINCGCKTEQDVFAYLGYDYVNPEDR